LLYACKKLPTRTLHAFPSKMTILYAIVLLYTFVESIFYIIYTIYLKPRANDFSRNTIKPFRDYDQFNQPNRRRHLLFKRIMERIEARSRFGNKDFRVEFDAFFRGWFCFEEKKNQGNAQSKLDPVIDYEGVLDLFSWAFFDKLRVHLKDWEREELDITMDILKERGLLYPKRSTHNRKWASPLLMSLDKGNPLHRPIFIYIVSWLIRQVSYTSLHFLGFHRHHVKTQKGKKLWYWYRFGTCKNVDGVKGNRNPILFFHGIAPGGLAFYLPMLRYFLSNLSQPVLLFENLHITWYLSFEALSEEETVYGVEQVLRNHGFYETTSKLTLCGHSFGSFQLTWFLKANQIYPMIHKFVLLDPVSILLSYPDVTLNFLYGGSEKDNANKQIYWTKLKIWLLASSELFIEHYMRRHLAWYNSELWIEDIPDHIHVHIFLSENDVFINAAEVKEELNRHNRESIRYTFWEGIQHGDCVTHSDLWDDILQVFNDSGCDVNSPLCRKKLR